LDVACGFLKFAISSVGPLSARYFLRPAKGGFLPPPGTHMQDTAVDLPDICILHVSAGRGAKKMGGPQVFSTQNRRQTLMYAILLPVSKSHMYSIYRTL
jgi:hypothetical protein